MAQVVTLTEAAKLSNNDLVEGIISDIVTVDAWFQYLPFVVFEGLSYTFVREATLAAADFAAPGANLNQSKYQSGATFENVNVNLTAIIADIILDGQTEDQLSETNDQLSVQISSKAKVIARLYMNAIVNLKRSASLTASNNGYIGISDRFNGMKSILDSESGNVDDVNHPFYDGGSPTQSLSLVEDDGGSRDGFPGRVFTLEDMDDLIDRITVADPDFIMMHARDIRTLRTLLRNTGGGTDASQIQRAGLGNARPQLMYQDIPVFRNDFISRQEAVHTQTLAYDAGSSAATTLAVGSAATAPLAGLETVALARGTDGVLYRWDISAGAGSTSLTVGNTGSFYDPEQGKVIARIDADSSLLSDGQDVVVAERVDGSAIYCGCWGEYKGVVGFTSANNAGLKLEYVGPREDENAYQYRMKWYVGFDLYNRLALARMKDVLPLGS